MIDGSSLQRSPGLAGAERPRPEPPQPRRRVSRSDAAALVGRRQRRPSLRLHPDGDGTQAASWQYVPVLLALALVLAQAAPPDLELEIRATVREVRIEQKGETSLEVRAEPDAGSRVDVDRPPSGGRARLRNVTVRVKAEARIADPADNRPAPETDSPQ